MKEIKGLTLSRSNITSSSDNIVSRITGETGAVFSVQIIDASSQNKSYNFRTNTFTTAFISENVLTNVEMSGSHYDINISIPAAASGNTYKVMVFADPFFNTKIADSASSSDYLLTASTEQGSDVTVRFSTSTDQDATNLVGVGAFIGSTVGSSNSTSNTEVDFTEEIQDSSTGSHGYKYTLPSTTNKSNTLDSALQPVDSDFYTAVSTQTDGAGTDSTSMVLDSVDNLVIGMDLVSIADSSDLEQGGSLGVLTYPNITAIDTSAKTITLSAAPDWGDDKAVVFRAYGSELIRKSTGGVFEYNLNVIPVGGVSSEERVKNWGTCRVNGAVSGSDSFAVDGLRGASAGSFIVGAGVNSEDNANQIVSVHSSGTPIQVSGNQTLVDNTFLYMYGSGYKAIIEGTITIKRFPSISVDVYYDIDRAFVLATLS
jgi:hypothetical protein